MDKKIGVITDSNACLDYFDHDFDIPIFRSRIHFGEEEYLDHTELTATDFYKRLKEDKSAFPRTSQYPTELMIETYEKMKAQGYTDIIVVTISQHMSGIHSACLVAKEKVSGIDVHVVDSKSVAYPLAKMALTAAAMAREGKPLEEILETIHFIRDNNKVYITVETLVYLVKNGRLSNAQGMLGSMLKIKPLLHISKEGKVETVEKIRTFKKAVDRMIERYLEETRGKDIEPFICHAANDEAAEYIKTRLKEENLNLGEIFTMPLTPGIGAHSGPKATGLGYFVKKPS